MSRRNPNSTLSQWLRRHFKLATVTFFVGFGLTACAGGEQGEEAPLQAEASDSPEGQAAADGEVVADEASDAASSDALPQVDEASLAPVGEGVDEGAPALPEDDSAVTAGGADGGGTTPAPAEVLPVDPAPAEAALTQKNAEGSYIVQSGDTLGRISQKIYGSPGHWQHLASVNSISAPYLIFPGNEIRFELSNERAKQFAQKLQNVPTLTLTVKAGDTLSGLAEKIYGDSFKWTLLHAANKDKISNPHVIDAGMVLSYMDPKAFAQVVGTKFNKHKASKLKKKASAKAPLTKPVTPPNDVTNDAGDETPEAAPAAQSKAQQPVAEPAAIKIDEDDESTTSPEDEVPVDEPAKEDVAASPSDLDPEIEDEEVDE